MASNPNDESRFYAVEIALRDDPFKSFDGHAAIHHIDISCDGCDEEPIIGKRFKCQVCEDRDLCETCMRALIAARVKMSKEAGPISDPSPPSGPRPKRWISKLRSDDAKTKWGALMQVVPCLHSSHVFARMDWGPERAVVLTLLSTLSSKACSDLAAKFLETFPPSGANCADVAWIIVDPPKESGNTMEERKKDDIEDRVEAALENWEKIITQRKPTADDVGTLAKRHRILRGKWIAFPKTSEEADAAWRSMVHAAAEGALTGCSQVKISATNPKEPGYVLCAYTEDYLNEIEVNAAATALRNVLPKLSDIRLLYKADIYTHFGIYSRNEWGLKPTIYSATL